MDYKTIIETLRKRAGYTQEQLASMVGLSSQRRYSTRLGTNVDPKIGFTQRVLKVLGYKLVFVPEATEMQEDWFEPAIAKGSKKDK